MVDYIKVQSTSIQGNGIWSLHLVECMMAPAILLGKVRLLEKDGPTAGILLVELERRDARIHDRHE